MKNKFIFLLLLNLMVSSTGFYSCKKKKAFKEEDGQASTDNRNVQLENDNTTNEINSEVGNNVLMNGRISSSNGVNTLQTALGISATGYSVDVSSSNIGSIQINYDGTTVSNRTRTGSIKLTILDYVNGKRWKQAGCVLKVDYLNYKVTRASDGKSVEINGTQNITNNTGGSWWELIIIKTQTSISSSVSGTNLSVKFDGDKTATYNINRKFTYTFPNNIITCTGEGTGASDGLSNLENYGITRDGDSFTSQVSTPIVWNWTCGWWAPVQGAVNIKVVDKDFDLKVNFSVDKNGNSVSAAANSCPYGWKVEWTNKKKTNKKVFGYL